MGISGQRLQRDRLIPRPDEAARRRASPPGVDAGHADRCRLAVLVSRQERWSSWLGWVALEKRLRHAHEQVRRLQSFRIRPG